jgi:hypothetical protein
VRGNTLMHRRGAYQIKIVTGFVEIWIANEQFLQLKAF